MEDPEVVAAIVAGDAADAVQDTFLVATAKLRGLHDPGKPRPRLGAVARNACSRRLRARTAHSGLDEAADVPAQPAGIGLAAERAELRALVRAAMDGLNPGDRTSSS